MKKKAHTHKHWYHSKTIWFNVIMTVLDAVSLLKDLKIGGESVGLYLAVIHGIGNIVLRVWFNNQKIKR
jgi:hypothetical protein